MSWSVNAKGTKADVVNRISEQLDGAAATYKGTEEAKDVAAAKDRILSLLDALDLPDDVSADWIVEANAYGSHSSTERGLVSASMHLSVSCASAPGSGG